MAKPTKRFLFLDRDGVINTRRVDDYVTSLSEWEWREDFLAIISFLSRFERVVVVTNQRGISLGRMSEQDLSHIHHAMIETIEKLGGKIDGVFYCPHSKDAHCLCRKPAIGLALQAQKAFPDIVFQESMLIGDSESDIQMGNALGMTTYLLTDFLDSPSQATFKIQQLSAVLHT